MNNTVYFNPEWMEVLSVLTEECRNRVISGIVTYQTTGNIPENVSKSPSFLFMKMEVDRRNRRLAKAKDKRMQKKAEKYIETETPACDSQNDAIQQDGMKESGVRLNPVIQQKCPKPESAAITPEKKAAIASLLGSLMQPRPNPLE